MQRFEIVLTPGTTWDRPGIYHWQAGRHGCYVGKYRHRARPLRAYRRNVERLILGLPYRKSNVRRFRTVHRALADAWLWAEPIVLTCLDNDDACALHALEQQFIAKLRPELNGGHRVIDRIVLEELIRMVSEHAVDGVYPSALIGMLRERKSAVQPAMVRPALDQLVGEGRLARFGHRYFAVGEIEAARNTLLASLALQEAKFLELPDGAERFRGTEAAIKCWDGR